MRQTYNVDADKENKVQPGPEWVTKEVVDMWYRIDKKAKETGISYTKAGEKYGFSPSSVYNTIAAIKRGQPPRDTEFRIIEALAQEMKVPLNYLVHGETEETNNNNSNGINENTLDCIFSLSNGSALSLFLMSLPHLETSGIESIREDILSRFN